MTTLINPGQKNGMRLTNKQLGIILNGCMLNQRGAQKEVYCIYYNYAMSIALRYSSGYDNAIEMTNDAFVRMYRGLKNFTPRVNDIAGSFTAWLGKVVVSACIDHLNKYNKKELLITGIDPEQVVLPDEGETAERMLQRKEIMKCIEQLSPAYK